MVDVIVGIHGLANKPPKSKLDAWWKAALDEGLEKNLKIKDARYKFEMVYWADLLYKNRIHFDKQMSFDQLYSEEPYIPARKGALKKYEDEWTDLARVKASDVAGTISKTLKYLAFYYDEKRQIKDHNGELRVTRQVLMGEVEGKLRPLEGEHVMVIAHSLGSIIAYDVLRDLGRTDQPVRVSDFVTIGSPLGLPLVKANIVQERKHYSKKAPVRTPTIITERWLNFADRNDLVAFDTHLRGHYGPNDSGIRVTDDLVANDYVGSTGEPNHNKSYGYLRTPEMSECVAKFLGRG